MQKKLLWDCFVIIYTSKISAVLQYVHIRLILM